MYGETKLIEKSDKYLSKTKYTFKCLLCEEEYRKEYRYRDKKHTCSSYRKKII